MAAVLLINTRENFKRKVFVASDRADETNRVAHRPGDILAAYPEEKCGSGCRPGAAFVRVGGVSVEQLQHLAEPWHEAITEVEQITARDFVDSRSGFTDEFGFFFENVATKRLVRQRVWRIDMDALTPREANGVTVDRDISITALRLRELLFNKRLLKTDVIIEPAERTQDMTAERDIEDEVRILHQELNRG